MATPPTAAFAPAPPGYPDATLHLDIDPAEHQRRNEAGISVVTGHGFGGLDVLMTLPHGLPVPMANLTDHQRAYVQRVPAGICTVTDGQVTRHAVRPCRVALATVHAKSASKLALDAVSRFAPFCTRRIVITQAPSLRMPERLLEFGFYGIGVTLEHASGELETLVEPRPWRPMRHTPAGWYFAERAYGAWLREEPTPG